MERTFPGRRLPHEARLGGDARMKESDQVDEG